MFDVNYSTFLNTLASGRFREKIPELHVALCMNFSGLVCATDPVKVSKDTASLLVRIRKNFCVGCTNFF